MNDQAGNKGEKPPEYRAFEEALSIALSVLKSELQQRVSEVKSEKVSRYKRYKCASPTKSALAGKRR